MKLKYHQATFDLLGIVAVSSDAAKRLLDQREAALGLVFPPSVREWYSIDESTEILEKCSNSDRAVPLNLLGDPEELKHGLLRIQVESQSVATWYLRLDGSEDPPVEVESELLGVTEELCEVGDLGTANLRREANRFSEFVYQRALRYAGSAASRKAVKAIKIAGGLITFDDDGTILNVHFPSGKAAQAGGDALAGVFIHGVLEIPSRGVSPATWTKIANARHLNGLYVTGAKFDDKALKAIALVPGLRDLTLYDTGVTDSGLALFFEKVSLKKLRIFSSSLSKEGYQSIRAQKELEVLLLSGSTLTNQSLDGVSDLPNLRRIDLTNTTLTDDGLAALTKLSRIERLNLSMCQINGEGLRYVSGLQSLRELNLRATLVGDSAILALGNLPSLERLDLSSTLVTDKAFAYLERFPKLALVELMQTSVSEAAISRLAKSRPNLKIRTKSL